MTSRWTSGVQHHPKRKAFQCKHIPNDMMIEAVRSTKSFSDWKMRWDVEKELRSLLGDHAPVGLAKVMMAKFAKMEKQGLHHGCSCGCRGDYHIPNEIQFYC